MTIDSVAEKMEWLQKYELPKIRILDNVLKVMRAVQLEIGTENGIKIMKDEMNTIRNVTKRLDSVINGEIIRFKENKNIVTRLQEQKRILSEIERFAIFYQKNEELSILNSTYNRLVEAIKSFITLSQSMVNIKTIEKAA